MRPWGSKPRLLTKNQSLRAPQVQYKRPQLDSKSTSHVLLTYLKLQSKTPFNQSTISQFRNLGVEIWIQGNLPSLPYNLSQFPLLGDYGSKFQTRYIFMVFCTFVISILILSCQSTISILLIIHLEFWAWFSTNKHF